MILYPVGVGGDAFDPLLGMEQRQQTRSRPQHAMQENWLPLGQLAVTQRDRSREDALAKLKAMNWSLPPGFRFSRDEANER